MTGTSLDGADVACCRIAGTGRALDLEVLATGHLPYPPELHAELLELVELQRAELRTIAVVETALAEWWSEALRRVLADADLDPGVLDLVGVHGQTVVHQPEPVRIGDRTAAGTLQLGSGSALAARLRVPVVSDFRTADLALGGQGAPLVPYFDWIVLGRPDRARLVCNLGGIANCTVLPPGPEREEVRAFDAGPANVVIDALARRLFDEPFDRDGHRARTGSISRALLREVRAGDSFPDRSPPKSTGRAEYGAPFAERFAERAAERGCEPEDVLATATEYSARTLYEAYDRFVRPETQVDEVLLSGGGLRNETLVARIAEAFAPIPVRSTAPEGVDPNYKEAICFAVLAHERLEEASAAMPRATGASAAARLGQLALPPADR